MIHRLIPWLVSSLLTAAWTSGRAAAQQAPQAPQGPARSQEESPEGEAAQETEDGDLIHLQETVVTATRYEKSIYDIPMGVTLVDGDELRERTTATAADALRYKPGIWVQNTGNLRGSPVIRGFMGNRVVYLFDGIRRNTAGIFPGPNWFLQNTDALDIDRIEVIRGPGSVLYGSDAIGGVINVITNEKPAYTSGLDFGGRLYTVYNSDTRETSGRLESRFSGKDSYGFLGGTYRTIGDLEGGRGVGVQDPSASRERNWDAQYDYRLAAGHELEVFVQDFSRPSGRRFDQPNWRQTDDRTLVGMRYRASELAFMEDFEATAYYQDQEFFVDEQFFDIDSRDQTVGAELQATSFPQDDLRLVYGAHFHRDDVTRDNPQAGTEDPDVQWLNPAAFVLSEWQATERLRVDLGLRWDSFNLNSDAPPFNKLAPEMQSAINNGALSLEDLELDETDHALTGGVGAVYDLSDELSLVGHIGRAFRAPNKSDLLQFGQFTFGFGVPSPGLKPESSITYELGLRAQAEDFAGAVTAFYTELDDAIVTVPGTFNGSSFIDVNGNGVQDPTEGVFVKENSTGTVRATGIELEGRRWLPESWSRRLVGSNQLSAYGNFSWIYGEDTGNGEPLDRAYPANALLGLRLDESRNPEENDWWVALETWIVWKFDRIPSTRRTSDPAFFNDPQDPTSGLIGGDGSLPGFGIVNLRGGRRIGKNATLYLGVENLTDRAYRVKDSRIDGPGLNLTFGLEVSL